MIQYKQIAHGLFVRYSDTKLSQNILTQPK
nr:MAG TPA: hypothetical protein [Caudoviricetes sp.]